MVKVTGVQAHVGRLRKMVGPELVEKVTEALFVAGNSIQVEAQVSITTGAVSGRGHVASQPGEPPNADTHALDRQIETAVVEPLRVNVTSNAPHAVPLEVGSSKMAERPYMRPAAERKRGEVTDLVAQAVRAVNRAAGGA